MDISGQTKLFPIIGDPVQGVVSPPAINAWLRARGIDAQMVPLNIPAQSIGAFWELLRASETFLGCSVTYPHKQAAFAQVEVRTDRAERLGALNTIRCNPDGSLTGDATDGLALVQAITNKGVDLAGRTAHVIGAGGGAGRALIDVDATPNGKSDNATPLFSQTAIKGCEVVCDIAGNLETSQLLTTAEHVGKTIIKAQEMGQGQVEAQMNFLFNLSEISDLS